MPSQLQIADWTRTPATIERAESPIFLHTDSEVNVGQNFAPIIMSEVETPDFHEFRDYRLSKGHCNLFIAKGVNFSRKKNNFVLRKDKIFKNRRSERYDIYGEEVKTFPSLFVTANDGVSFRKCVNPNQMFLYGEITEVEDQGADVEISFRRLFNRAMFQKHLNEASVEIGINLDEVCFDRGVDVLAETQWLILAIDLRKRLTEAGIEYK